MGIKAIEGLPLKHRPYIFNYPPLQAWLDKHDARCLWQVAEGFSFIEGWQVGKAVCIIHVYPNGRGWYIYTATSSNKVDETFADAEARLGLPIGDEPETCEGCKRVTEMTYKAEDKAYYCDECGHANMPEIK